jgi:hypothetical protein
VKRGPRRSSADEQVATAALRNQVRRQQREIAALKRRTDPVRYDYSLQTLKDLPYARWREYDPEDTIRFYALRLHEVGMIKSTPQKIIAQGTDRRFLDELKQELKG